MIGSGEDVLSDLTDQLWHWLLRLRKKKSLNVQAQEATNVCSDFFFFFYLNLQTVTLVWEKTVCQSFPGPVYLGNGEIAKQKQKKICF